MVNLSIIIHNAGNLKLKFEVILADLITKYNEKEKFDPTFCAINLPLIGMY